MFIKKHFRFELPLKMLAWFFVTALLLIGFMALIYQTDNKYKNAQAPIRNGELTIDEDFFLIESSIPS